MTKITKEVTVVPHFHPSLPDHLEQIFKPTNIIKNKGSTLEELKIATGQQEIIGYLRDRLADLEQESDEADTP